MQISFSIHHKIKEKFFSKICGLKIIDELKKILSKSILEVKIWQKSKELKSGPDQKDIIEKLEVKEEEELSTKKTI